MTDRELNCLLCNENYSETKIISHIHEHMDYFPYKCKQCDFRSIVFDQLIKHRVKSGHKVSRNAHRNRYSEYLCQKIYEDILKVEDDGLAGADWLSENDSDEEIFESDKIREKRVASIVRRNSIENSKDVPPNQKEAYKSGEKSTKKTHENATSSKTIQEDGVSSSNVAVVSKNNHKKKLIQSENLEIRETTRDIEEEPIRQVENIKSTKKQTVQNSWNIMPSLSDLLENIIEQVTKGKKTVRCIQCKEEVANDFRTKEKHVQKFHPNFSIDACFPGSIATSELECPICGKEYRSETGRLNHVAEHHVEIFLKCPLCDAHSRVIPKMTEHFRKIHEIHENDLSPDMSKKWKAQKEEFYNRMNVLVKKVFPVKLKTAKNAENVEETVTQLLATRFFSPTKQPILPEHTLGPSTSSDGPISSPPRTVASALRNVTGGSKEKAQTTNENAEKSMQKVLRNVRKIYQENTSDSDESSEESDGSLPGQAKLKKRTILAKNLPPITSSKKDVKKTNTINWHVRLPSPDSSSIELSSDSEDENNTRKKDLSKILKNIKTEPTSEDNFSEEQASDEAPDNSENVVEHEQIKSEEMEEEMENFDLEEEDIVKIEDPLLEENTPTISNITDQQIFDHFGVKNNAELFSIPQFVPPSKWNVNMEIFEKYKTVCYKFLRKTMLSLAPEKFSVYELYRVRSLFKLNAFPPLFSLFTMIKGLFCCQICGVTKFRNMTAKVMHIFSCGHIVKICFTTKNEPPEILEFFEKFETSTSDFRLLYVPIKLEKLFHHFQVNSEQDFLGLPQFSRNRFFNARIFELLRAKYIRSFPNTMLSLPPSKFFIETLVYLSEIDLQTAQKVPKLNHIFRVSKTQTCMACPTFTYNTWFVYMKHLFSIDHLKCLYIKKQPEPDEIRQVLFEFDTKFMLEHPLKTIATTTRQADTLPTHQTLYNSLGSASRSMFNQNRSSHSTPGGGFGRRKRVYSNNSNTQTNRRAGKRLKRSETKHSN